MSQMNESQCLQLCDLPQHVIARHIMAKLPARSILQLGLASKEFQAIVNNYPWRSLRLVLTSKDKRESIATFLRTMRRKEELTEVTIVLKFVFEETWLGLPPRVFEKVHQLRIVFAAHINGFEHICDDLRLAFPNVESLALDWLNMNFGNLQVANQKLYHDFWNLKCLEISNITPRPDLEAAIGYILRGTTNLLRICATKTASLHLPEELNHTVTECRLSTSGINPHAFANLKTLEINEGNYTMSSVPNTVENLTLNAAGSTEWGRGEDLPILSNVTTLKLELSKVRQDPNHVLKTVSSSFPNIHGVLIGCDGRVLDDGLTYLGDLDQLASLHVRGASKVNGAFLIEGEFASLSRVTFRQCDGLMARVVECATKLKKELRKGGIMIYQC